MMTLDEAIKKARDLGLTLSCKPETKEEGREQMQLSELYHNTHQVAS